MNIDDHTSVGSGLLGEIRTDTHLPLWDAARRDLEESAYNYLSAIIGAYSELRWHADSPEERRLFESTVRGYLAEDARLPNSAEFLEIHQLVDSLCVLSRDGDVLYRNELMNGEWGRDLAARQAIEAERGRQELWR